MKKILFGLAALLVLAAGCEPYQTVDCLREGVRLIGVGQYDSLAGIHIAAYERGSHFDNLVKEKTYQLNQMPHYRMGLTVHSPGSDTVVYVANDPYNKNDFFTPRPEQYDWRITNISTGGVYRITEIQLSEQTTVKVKKGDPNPCVASTLDYKVNDTNTHGKQPYTIIKGGILVFINL